MSESDAVNQFTDVKLFNPFVTGIARSGWQFAFEPLYFYNMYNTDQVCGPPGMPCQGGEIPWQAESYAYNSDYTELNIKLRPQVTWSDGQPFTANDVVFTLNMLKDNAPKLIYSVEMKTWVKDVVAVDDHNVKVTLTQANPRFMFDYLQWHSDLGLPIVPEHIFKGQDPTTFTNYDLSKNWPIVTGPWQLKASLPEQKFWDRRDDWWGAKVGFHPLPAMKRVIVLPNYTDDKQAELLVANQVDCTHGFQAPYIIPSVLPRNPKLHMWTTGDKPPYGVVDMSTVTTLDFNDAKAPFNDTQIRWAINHALDRKQIISIGTHGIGDPTSLPFPPYGVMKQYYDAVSDILQKYPIDAFDLNKTAQIMQSKGYAKDQAGFWAKGGKRFSFIITLPPPFFTDITPVIVAQLRKGGFDVTFKSPTNRGTLVSTGEVDAFLDIPGGSVRDPYTTLSFDTTKLSAPTGQPAVQPYRWKNEQYDTLLDELAKLPGSDPKFMQIYHQAMEIWIPNLPQIPLIQRYMFLPVNTTYWTNWPDEKNPYITPSSWHRTAGMFIHSLKSVTA